MNEPIIITSKNVSRLFKRAVKKLRLADIQPIFPPFIEPSRPLTEKEFREHYKLDIRIK